MILLLRVAQPILRSAGPHVGVVPYMSVPRRPRRGDDLLVGAE